MSANKSHASARKDMLSLLSRKCHWKQQPDTTRKGKSVIFLDQSLKNQVEEKEVISAVTQAGLPVTHRKYLPPLYGFPLPFDTYKQSCLYTKSTWEGRRETHFHITREGFVSAIHSAIAVCARGDLGDLQRLLFIFIQVPGWKFQHQLLVGFRITRGMNLLLWLANNLESKESKLSFTYCSHCNEVTYQPSGSNPIHITGV